MVAADESFLNNNVLLMVALMKKEKRIARIGESECDCSLWELWKTGSCDLRGCAKNDFSENIL